MRIVAGASGGPERRAGVGRIMQGRTDDRCKRAHVETSQPRSSTIIPPSPKDAGSLRKTAGATKNRPSVFCQLVLQVGEKRTVCFGKVGYLPMSLRIFLKPSSETFVPSTEVLPSYSSCSMTNHSVPPTS